MMMIESFQVSAPKGFNSMGDLGPPAKEIGSLLRLEGKRKYI